VPLIEVKRNPDCETSISHNQLQSILPPTVFQYLNSVDFIKVLESIHKFYHEIIEKNINYYLHTHASAAVENEIKKILFVEDKQH
jgi:hypothetical protein